MDDAPKPAILHWGQKHFVVLTPSSKKQTLTIADPAKGLITYSKKEFLSHWSNANTNGDATGIALLLEPTPEFYAQEDDKESRVGWGMLLKYMAGQKRFIVQLFIGLMVGSLLQLIFPFLTQSIVDVGIATHNL